MEDFRSGLTVEFARIVSLLLGKVLWRVKYHNKQYIAETPDAGLLIVANHQSYLDPFLVSAPMRRKVRYMAWDVPFRWFFVGRLLKKLGAFPVSLKKGGTIAALKDAIKILKSGEALMIFPEAAREFSDGKLLEFKTGAVRLAIETGAAILPVTVKGANRVWSRDHRFPRLRKIEIFYHEPFILGAESSDDLQTRISEGNEKLREIISSVLV